MHLMLYSGTHRHDLRRREEVKVAQHRSNGMADYSTKGRR